MTETTGNKQILNIVGAMSKVMSLYYLNNDIKGQQEVLSDLISYCKELDKIPTKYNQNVEYLTHSLGNKKIGKDTLCISISTGLLCPMGLTGNCDNCGICYAVNQNKMYFKNTVPKNSLNQILINKILLNEVSLHKVLFETIWSINCSYTQKEVQNIKFLRFNVEGDILNNQILAILETVASVLSDVFGLVSCYSYTHNKELDLSIAPTINFNTSDFESETSASSVGCYTVYSISNDLRQKILNKEVILCNGNCNNCSYCKDKNNRKPVLFLVHGGQFEGIEAIKKNDKELFKFISKHKVLDYWEFVRGNSHK